jgi:hypothetical protein
MWKHAIKRTDTSTSSPPSECVLFIYIFIYFTQTFIDLLMNKLLGDLFCEYTRKYLISTTKGNLQMKTNFMFIQHFRLANSISITPLTNST